MGSSGSKQIRFRAIFAAIGVLSVLSVTTVGTLACATAPHFEPSRPVSQAASAREGLLLCNEYSLPSDAPRPIALEPYVDCVDRVLSDHPTDAPEAAQVFQAELHSVWHALDDANWTRRFGDELETGIHTILAALASDSKGPSMRVTRDERDLAQKHFNRSASLLGASDWKLTTDSILDPKLEELLARVRGMSDAELQTAANCKTLRETKAELDGLKKLWQDQREMSLQSPESAQAQAAQKLYVSRLNSAQGRVELVQKKISATSPEQKKQQPGFRCTL